MSLWECGFDDDDDDDAGVFLCSLRESVELCSFSILVFHSMIFVSRLSILVYFLSRGRLAISFVNCARLGSRGRDIPHLLQRNLSAFSFLYIASNLSSSIWAVIVWEESQVELGCEDMGGMVAVQRF